jgi:hypothetical protein
MSAEIVRAHPLRDLPANFDKRIAAAYLEIESLVRDVDRMAHIARDLAIKVGGTGRDVELAQFATVQLEKIAKHLLAEYDRLWEKARAT